MRILAHREELESLPSNIYLYDGKGRLWESGELRIYFRDNPGQESYVLPVVTLSVGPEIRDLAIKKLKDYQGKRG